MIISNVPLLRWNVNKELTIKGTGIQIGMMAPRHSTYVILNTLKITLYQNYNYGDSSKTTPSGTRRSRLQSVRTFQFIVGMIFLHRSLCIPLHLYTKIYINVRLQERHSTERLEYRRRAGPAVPLCIKITIRWIAASPAARVEQITYYKSSLHTTSNRIKTAIPPATVQTLGYVQSRGVVQRGCVTASVSGECSVMVVCEARVTVRASGSRRT